jgi:long-chain acyl-CoA synthetase
VVRTQTQASGYYRNDAQTRESFRGGWFHTGDLGLIDEHKRVHVLERVAAVTTLHGGLLICPSKLEALYESSRAVQNVFVWGDRTRSRVVAVVQPSGTGRADADTIRADFVRIGMHYAPAHLTRPLPVYQPL